MAKLTFLDRAIGWIDPRAGVKRAHARAAMEMIRSYEGAKTGRRTQNWIATGSSANTAIAGKGAKLRDRARDLVRNSPHAKRALQIMVANVVGDGIVGASATGDAALDKRVQDLWDAWQARCDADSDLDFCGVQALAFRAALEGGDSFIRFRPRRMDDGLDVPLQLQLMEGDYLDQTRDSSLGGVTGTTRLGIAFDAIGNRTGYWMYREHPGEMALKSSLESGFVPAREVLHLFVKDRPGQIIGASWFAPVIMALQDLADLNDAILYREKINSAITGILESPDGMDIGEVEDAPSGGGVQYETVEPGTYMRTRPGETYKPAPPPNTDTSYNEFVKNTLMMIASGLGLTYDQITGDLSQANYSSLRAGKIEQRRVVSQMQWGLAIPRLCQPVWDRFVLEAQAAGKLPEGRYPVRWLPPSHEYIDPHSDLEADILAVQAGAKTWTQLVQERGYDPVKQAEEIAAERKMFDKLGIDLKEALNYGASTRPDPGRMAPAQRELRLIGRA